MKYSEVFKKMVKAHQGKFIGYGNPNAKILIIVPKIDDKRLLVYNSNNSKLWLANIKKHTDFNDVEDFFVEGKQVGNEMTFNPLHPFKGQRDIVFKKARNGAVSCIDGTCNSWHLIQYLLSGLQWEFDDKINFFNNAFYTIFDDELLKDPYFQKYKNIMYSFEDEDQFRSQNPVKLFGMKYYWGRQNKPEGAQRMIIYHKEGTDKQMMVTIAYEKAWKKNLERIKGYIDGYSRIRGIIDDTFVKKYIDKLAKGEISDPESRKKACDYILKTISNDVSERSNNCWINMWEYAYRNLKEEYANSFIDSKKRDFPDYCKTIAALLFYADHYIVRDIVTYIIKRDKFYWNILSSAIKRCYRSWDRAIPEITYQELMKIFNDINSTEDRTILLGQLIWYRRMYQDIISKPHDKYFF